MEFKFENHYNQKAVKTMARVLRKTVRKKRSRRLSIFSGVLILLALLLSLYAQTATLILNITVIVVLLVVLIWQDQINAWVARKRALPGTETATVVFQEEYYHSATEVGQSQFYYDKVTLLAETSGYFVFIFGKNHGQIHDKSTLTGGTLEEFRQFIQQKTGKTIQPVK